MRASLHAAIAAYVLMGTTPAMTQMAPAEPTAEQPSAPAAPVPAAPVQGPASAPQTTHAKARAATGPAVYPHAIAANYAKESAGKGRRQTCLDQYKANKATNENGGLKWIQKGGGYYSACSKKLKG